MQLASSVVRVHLCCMRLGDQQKHGFSNIGNHSHTAGKAVWALTYGGILLFHFFTAEASMMCQLTTGN